MSKTQVVGNISDWSGMFKDMWRQIGDGSLTLSHFQALLEHRNPFDVSDIRSEWSEFYRKYFRLAVDFSEVSIPEETEGFTRVLFIPKGLTINQAFQACAKAFKSWSHTNDLDKEVPTNDRTTEKSYAICIRDRVEADEELKNLSANDLQKRNIASITLLERLVYELKYFSETNQHLDIQNITLCAGSRRRGGGVPDVDWGGGNGQLSVDWDGSDSAGGSLRGRVAVS